MAESTRPIYSATVKIEVEAPTFQDARDTIEDILAPAVEADLFTGFVVQATNLADALEESGWTAPAEEIRNGVHPRTVLDRIYQIEGGTTEGYEEARGILADYHQE